MHQSDRHSIPRSQAIAFGIPKKFAAALTQYGKLAGHQDLRGAGQAFMNPNNKQGYDTAAAQDAWGRIDSFFERLLRPGT